MALFSLDARVIDVVLRRARPRQGSRSFNTAGAADACSPTGDRVFGPRALPYAKECTGNAEASYSIFPSAAPAMTTVVQKFNADASQDRNGRHGTLWLPSRVYRATVG